MEITAFEVYSDFVFRSRRSHLLSSCTTSISAIDVTKKKTAIPTKVIFRTTIIVSLPSAIQHASTAVIFPGFCSVAFSQNLDLPNWAIAGSFNPR